MKRIKFLLLLIVPILLTGCANTLKCEIETSNYTSKIKVKFENDKPLTYNFKDEMKFSVNDADSEIYYHSKYTEFNDLINDKFASVRNGKEAVSVKINYNFKENKSEGENKLLVKRDDTKSTASKRIESSGYTCK